MPIELGIWRINDGLERIKYSSIDNEKKLENILCQDIRIIDNDLMYIGNQIQTDYGKALDMLAINRAGELVVIELKRNKTPREVVAQVLDYATWVEHLRYETVNNFFEENHKGIKLEKAFSDYFEVEIPEEFNESHRLIIVASELDNSTERIINYLSANGIPINAIFFRYFKEGKNEYLTRSWLIDPFIEEESRRKITRPQKGLWNGRDWYVSLGIGETRNWEDCQKYGFISAGGGKWYSNTLALLPIDARIFVCVPGSGYVGVGIVKQTSVPVKDFFVPKNGVLDPNNENLIPILEAEHKAPNLGENANDLEKSEYLVKVEWIKTLPLEKAIWEKGMFANQNSACKLRNSFTIERLTQRFGLEE